MYSVYNIFSEVPPLSNQGLLAYLGQMGKSDTNCVAEMPCWTCLIFEEKNGDDTAVFLYYTRISL